MLSWRKNSNFTLSILKQNICDIKAEVIVNPANTKLKLGAGIAGALFERAGPRLQEECNNYILKKGELKSGDIVVTGKGNMENLKLKFIYHAVGPIWQGGQRKEDMILKTCFDNILHKANKSKINSIAIPLISSGIFGFPKDQASKIFLTSSDNFAHDGYNYPKEIFMPIMDTETFSIFIKIMKDFIVGKDIDYIEINENLKM